MEGVLGFGVIALKEGGCETLVFPDDFDVVVTSNALCVAVAISD